MPTTDLVAALRPDPAVLSLFRPLDVRRYRSIPLRRENALLFVAMANPADLAAIEEMEFLTGLKIRPVASNAAAVEGAIAHYYAETRLPAPVAPASEPGAESAVVRVQRLIFAEAERLGASDVHLDPGERHGRIRYRVDGLLRPAFDVPRWLHERLVARIKVTAQLDVSEKRLPQDGHISESGFEARLSTLPTWRGEAVVIRRFGDRGAPPSLDAIGGGEALQTRLRAISHRSQGILIVAGPTGSGKTTTLYAMINELRRRPLNIVTIEDPVEYRVDGVRQVEVDEKAGRTFHAALRATLRQDPDVILVGEIRDAETARTAFHASLTGHLVLSTLHATEAPATLLRLVELGIERPVIAAGMIGALAQRLVRRNCPHCLEPDRPPAFIRERLGLGPADEPHLRGSRGCPACGFSGASGRVALFELLELSPAVMEHVVSGRDRELGAAAAGYAPVIAQALGLVRTGEISALEAYRTCYFGGDA